MNATRRLLAATITSLPETGVAELPKSISSAQLPRSIFKYVTSHLRTRTPEQGDPSLPQITAPSHVSSSTAARHVSVPNPFLLQKLPFLVERVDGTFSEMNRYKLHINKRQQKKLLSKHSNHHLPPSSVNPIQSPPKVIWHRKGEHFQTEISWEGDWAVKENKGLYAGRKVMFKGHKRARERPEKKTVTEERVKDMPRRVDEWRAVSRISAVLCLVSTLTLSRRKGRRNRV